MKVRDTLGSVSMAFSFVNVSASDSISSDALAALLDDVAKQGTPTATLSAIRAVAPVMNITDISLELEMLDILGSCGVFSEPTHGGLAQLVHIQCRDEAAPRRRAG